MQARPAANSGPRPSPVIDPENSEIQIRPARLDRPLRKTSLAPTYTDPHLEELVRVAAERARHEARAEGYAAGWSEGRKAAAVKARAAKDLYAEQVADERALVGQRVRELLAELAAAARTARVTTVPEWTEVADVLAEGSIRLAASVLGRELESVDDAVAQSVRMALRRLAEPGEAVVHLNPTDAALVQDDETLGVRVIADPNIPTGSVLVLTPSQRLRHDLPAALAAAEEVLKS
jgi:flagellar assembly protein FliH